MHHLATVHARDNQRPTNQPTNDQRRHDTAYLNKRLLYLRKVRRLIICQTIATSSRVPVSSYGWWMDEVAVAVDLALTANNSLAAIS